MYSVTVTKKATKQLRKIDATARAKIFPELNGLSAWPDCNNVRKLVNRENFRLRVGSYRVLFTVDTKAQEITIQEVKKRDERTY